MAKYRVIKFGDCDGVGSIVEVKGLLRTRTYTVQNNNLGSDWKIWICFEDGKLMFADGLARVIDRFYKAQHVLSEIGNVKQMKSKIDETRLCDSNVKMVDVNSGDFIEDECSATGYSCEYEKTLVPSEFFYGEEGGESVIVEQCKYCGKVKE